MPLYEYQCEKCGKRFERIQKFSDPPMRKCPECGGVVERLLSAPAVRFKGSGWYATDYAHKPAATATAEGSDGKPPETAPKGEEKSPVKGEPRAGKKSQEKKK